MESFEAQDTRFGMRASIVVRRPNLAKRVALRRADLRARRSGVRIRMTEDRRVFTPATITPKWRQVAAPVGGGAGEQPLGRGLRVQGARSFAGWQDAAAHQHGADDHAGPWDACGPTRVRTCGVWSELPEPGRAPGSPERPRHPIVRLYLRDR